METDRGLEAKPIPARRKRMKGLFSLVLLLGLAAMVCLPDPVVERLSKPVRHTVQRALSISRSPAMPVRISDRDQPSSRHVARSTPTPHAISTTDGPGADATHTVRPGDTLSAVAALYGVTVHAIVKTNDIANANLIRVGQVLVLPSPNKSATPVPSR